MQLALHTSKPPNFSILEPNLQELEITIKGVVASPHLESKQLQAKRTKNKARKAQSKPPLQALTDGSENPRKKTQKGAQQDGKTRGKGLGPTLQQNSERDF